MTGDKLTLGHDEALGGVKGSPFKNLRLQGEKLNTALFNAYDKIQNKDLRARVLNSLEGQFKGLSGGDYQKAFIDAIFTTRTTMNTQIKGQIGYKADNLADQMTDAKGLYDQFKWVIK